MATLVFRVSAQYDEVIKLRNEISKLEAQLKKMDVNKSPAVAKALETQLASTRQQMMSLVTEAGRVGAVMENDFKKKIYDASQTVNDLSEKIIAQRTVVREVQADVKRLGETYRTALKNGPIGAASKKSEYDAARKALDEERAALFGLTQEQANARLSVKKLRDEYSLFKEESGDVKDAIGDITGQMKNWIAGIAGGIGIKEFLGQMIQVRGEFENIETSLRVLLGGDSEKLSDIMSQMKEYALISPLTTKDMASALQMMIGFGIQAEDAITYLKALGDISMGDTVHFNSLALAFSQMSAAGKLMGQDLNQMINAGFNPLQQISEKTGKSIGELKDEISKGAISAQMVQQAFIDATSEGGKFYGMASEGAKTLNGQISMLQESVDNMFNDMGQASEGVILNSIQAVTKLVENYEKVGKVIAGIIITYGVYRAATIANIVATEGWAAAATKDAVAKGAQTIATKALTVAQSALNSVIKANPYVLLATAIASVATAMWAFHDSAEATLQISNKFGEQASTTITKLNTLTSEVNGLAKGTSLRNKVMNELNGLLEEYGVQAIKEGDSIDSVNEKRKEAIELIKQEAIERDRLNNIDAGQQSYQQKLQDAQSDFLNSLKNARSGNDGAISFLSDNEEIQENAEAISTIIGSVVQENISKIAGKTGEEYEKGLNEIFDTIQDRMRAIGISERTISEVWVGGGLFSQSNIVRDYIEKVQEASEEHDRYTDAVNKAADAEKKAADSSSTYSQRIDMLAKSLQKPNDGVHQLYQNIKNLMSRYSDNTIGFTIRIGGEVPQWMNKKSLPELQKLAKQFSAIGEASKNGAFVNGKYMTQQQLLQRGADYATAAEQKQTEADRKKKELADKKKDSEKKNKNEKAIREQKRAEAIRKQAEILKNLEKNQSLDRKRDAVELENQVEQARINAMADGSDKTIAQREYDNKKELEAIDRAKEEYIQKEIQRQKEIFDAKEDLRAKQNPKYKKRSFDSSNVMVDSSSYDLLKEYTEKSQIQNEVNAQKEALNEYLKNYGTYQQKRLAISQEYSDKINKAQSEGERLSLQASMDDALSKLDFEQIKGNMNWEDVFGNLGDMTISQLERIRQQLRNMLSDGDLGLEEYKTAVEQIDKINTAIVEKNDEVKNTLGLILPMTQRRKEIEMEVAEAERTVNSLMHEMMEMQNSLNQQRESVAGYLQLSGISVGAKDIITSNFDNILSQIGGLFGEDSDIYKNVKKSFDDIAGSERKLTTTTQKLVKAQNDEYGARTKLNNFLTSFGNKLQAISDIMSLINSNIQSLPDLFSQLGVDMSSDFGKGISDLANASQSASNFIKDAMSGNFVGALSNGIGAVKGILSGFNNILGLGIGKGNVEYVTELTEKLTDSNDRLRDSIDRLKDKMDESAGGEAIKNYEQAKDAQEQLNRQTLEILKAQMSYTGAHHSNAYYWGEAIDGNAATSSRIYDSINKSLIEWLKTNPNANYSISSVNSYEDMFKLTPEQMAYIRDYNREIWNEITDIGKYDKSEYWENYADLAGQLENLTEQINENLTQVSFDSLRDSFMNTLLDMDADAQDFADDFGEYMMKSLLNYQLGDVFDEDLKKWYDDWAQMMSGQNGNLTDDQMNELKDRWEDMVDEALSMRDSIADITGYKGGSEEQQSASSKGFETMSQDTANELNGRFTALYESNLRIETAEQQQTVAITQLIGSISALTAQPSGMYNIADETRTILANSYLELQQIRENTGEIVKPIKQMQADIAEVKRNTAKL